MFDNNTLEWFYKKVSDWITLQNKYFLNVSKKLDLFETSRMSSYFELSTLNSVRISFVDVIDNPPFYTELMKIGIEDLIDFTKMSGITFGECIVFSKQKLNYPNNIVLFHELVHVVQYEIIGIEKFAREYVSGWLDNGYDYFKIPLEMQAYKLQNEFEINNNPFSVNTYLKKIIQQ